LSLLPRIARNWRAFRSCLDEAWGLENQYDVLLKGLKELAVESRGHPLLSEPDFAESLAKPDFPSSTGRSDPSIEDLVPSRRHLRERCNRKATI
jgi:hypothetical protein